MEDIYYQKYLKYPTKGDLSYKDKYLKYKRKYLELKYGGGLASLLKTKNLTKGLSFISNILKDIDIQSLIPAETKEEFNDQLVAYLNNMNNENVKLYLEDVKIIKPLLQDIGDLFLININEIMDNIDNIIKLKDKELTKDDIINIKNNLLQIQKDITKVKIKKPLKMAIILPQVLLKAQNLTVHIAQLKESHFIKSIPSFKKIVQKLKIPIL
jgi:hypothetical protein